MWRAAISIGNYLRDQACGTDVKLDPPLKLDKPCPPKLSNRGSITLGELWSKVTMLEVACHRCERRCRVSLARLIDEHGADTGLPDLWESLAGDCEHARSTALNNRCAIYYPQLPALFLTGRQP